jgi:hypothetical protein
MQDPTNGWEGTAVRRAIFVESLNLKEQLEWLM